MKEYKCEMCERSFSNGTSLEMHNLHKYSSKKERVDIFNEKKSSVSKKESYKKLSFYLLLAVFLIGIVYFIFYLTNVETYSNGNVHWHANLEISVSSITHALLHMTTGA